LVCSKKPIKHVWKNLQLYKINRKLDNKNKLYSKTTKGKLCLTKFSVVMSVYFGDSVLATAASLNSLLNQSLVPNEIILVVDGPIPLNLEKLINRFQEKKLIKVFKLDKNCGPGIAKGEGIKNTQYPLIAIMDSDDISMPDRFSRQIHLFENNDIDVVGGWIEEFNVLPGDLLQVRKVPLYSKDIISRSKWRNPINHVTLMFRKESYYKAGGYSSLRSCEDWELIVKMLTKGSIIINIPEILVKVRIGNSMLKRRRSFVHLKNELSLFYQMYRISYISLFQLSANILLRLGAYIFPSYLFQIYYKIFLRN